MRITLLTRDRILANSLRLMLADGGVGNLKCQAEAEFSPLPDVLLLDGALPEKPCRDALRQFARLGRAVPTLVLLGTRKSERPPKGFETADTLRVPYHRGDLIARIWTCYRARGEHLRIGRLMLDPKRRRAWVDATPVALTGREYDVLEMLASRLGVTISKEMFLDRLYGGCEEPEPKIIDVFICKIRRKLKKATGGDPLIATVWGRGYILRAPREADGVPAAVGQAAV